MRFLTSPWCFLDKTAPSLLLPALALRADSLLTRALASPFEGPLPRSRRNIGG